MSNALNEDREPARGVPGIKAASTIEQPIARQIARINSASMNIQNGLDTFVEKIDPVLSPLTHEYGTIDGVERIEMSSMAETLSTLADHLEAQARRLQDLPSRVEL